MTGHSYDGSRIALPAFDAGVRARPGRYFRFGQGDPRLPTAVLSAVAGHVLHPATAVAPSHSLSGLVEITGDLSFTVTLDEPHSWDGQEGPAAGYFGSLLGPAWFLPAAAAALTTRTVVEMWCGGRGFRQESTGLRPVSAPLEQAAPAGRGSQGNSPWPGGTSGRGPPSPGSPDGSIRASPPARSPRGPAVWSSGTSATPGGERCASLKSDAASENLFPRPVRSGILPPWRRS
ncbi:hypothetical protein OG937_35305 [Streptomyces sp. NBC_00510]